MIFDISAIVFAVLFSLYMMKKGGVKAILSLSSFFLSVIIASMAYPVVTEVLYSTPVCDYVEKSVEEALRERGDEATLDALDSIDAMPDFVRNSIEIQKNDTYEKIIRKATEDISRIILKVISFIAVVIVTKVILAILISMLNLTAKMPGIRQINSIVGLCGGVVISLVVVWLAVFVTGALSASNSTVADIVKDSHVVAFFGETAPF